MTDQPVDETLLVEHVRHLMADVSSTQYLTDAQVQVYLSINDGHVRRAAADALDAIATSETLVGKVIRTQDLQTDGAKVADSLRKHADRLRQLADAEDDKADSWDGFDVVDTVGRHNLSRPEWTPPYVSGL